MHDLRQKRLQAFELVGQRLNPQHKVGFRVRRFDDHNPDNGLRTGRPVAILPKADRTGNFPLRSQARYDACAVQFNSFASSQVRSNSL